MTFNRLSRFSNNVIYKLNVYVIVVLELMYDYNNSI